MTTFLDCSKCKDKDNAVANFDLACLQVIAHFDYKGFAGYDFYIMSKAKENWHVKLTKVKNRK